MGVFFELLGWVGSYCFLFSYYMLIGGRWTSNQPVYHWYNIIGSVLFVANGAYYSAWAVLFINFVWGVIACFGLYKSVSAK